MSLNPSPPSVAIIGGGPAGLMAAEAALSRGASVTLFDHLASVGRKILIAGKGGLNLTHSEPMAPFVARYGDAASVVAQWLREFGPNDLRDWARGLGVETMVGTSGRVFPHDLKAAPLLRGWLRRLRAQGLELRVHHRWLGFDENNIARFRTPDGEIDAYADAWVLAMGGASWPVLGSDGSWTDSLSTRGIEVRPLQPANVGFEVVWSEAFRQRYAGQPVKPVALSVPNARSDDRSASVERQGEFVITDYGVEGSLLYALGAELRQLGSGQDQQANLDLLPAQSMAQVEQKLSAERGKRSLSEFLRRRLGLQGVRLGLLYELGPKPLPTEPKEVARLLKRLPLPIVSPRPIDEAISSAGGVALDQINARLMLHGLPGVFCAGEMLDWEAPTGGYLLTACFASGKIAGVAAADWALGTCESSGPKHKVAATAPPSVTEPASEQTLSCPHFDAAQCRSCTHLDVQYAQQLNDKMQRVSARLALGDQAAWESPARSATTGFRNKAKLAVGGSIDHPTLGILDSQYRGVDLDQCLLYPPRIRRCFEPLRAFLRLAGIEPYSVKERNGEIKYVIITAAAGDPALMVRFVLRSKQAITAIRRHLPTLKSWLPELRVVSVNLQPKPAAIVEGPEEVVLTDEHHLPMRFGPIDMELLPGGFFQTNTDVAAELYRTAQRWAGELNIDAALDLFCGVGGFALHLAHAGLRTRGWEIHPAAVESAKRAAAKMGAAAEFCCAGVEQLQLADEPAGLWVVNPPRRGLGPELIEQVNAVRPAFLLYSSCNPDSLRDDLNALSDYEAQKARLFDMFPHTNHAEVMVLLRRASAPL